MYKLLKAMPNPSGIPLPCGCRGHVSSDRDECCQERLETQAGKGKDVV